MKNERYKTMLTLLQNQLEEEQQAYRSALIDDKEFWVLRLIRDRIKSLENSLALLKKNLVST